MTTRPSLIWLARTVFTWPSIAREPYLPLVDSTLHFELQTKDSLGHLWFTDQNQGFVEYDGQKWWLHRLKPESGDSAVVQYGDIRQDSGHRLVFKVYRRPAEQSGTSFPAFTSVHEYFRQDRQSRLKPVVSDNSETRNQVLFPMLRIKWGKLF